MSVQVVRNLDGVYRVGDTRVSLDSLVYLFREGLSLESMADCYPELTRGQVREALDFYLANQQIVDACLSERAAEAEVRHDQSRVVNRDLIARLQRARHASQIPG